MFRLLVVILTWLIFSANVSFAAEDVVVKTTETEKYTRLQFFCKQPMKFSAKLNGSKLNLSFGRQINLDTSLIQSAYVENAKFSSKFNTASITLAGSAYRIRKFIGENFVGVDVIRTAQAEIRRSKEDISVAKPAQVLSLPENIPEEAGIETSAGVGGEEKKNPEPVRLFNIEKSAEKNNFEEIAPTPVEEHSFVPTPKLKQVFEKTAAIPEEKAESISTEKLAQKSSSSVAATPRIPATERVAPQAKVDAPLPESSVAEKKPAVVLEPAKNSPEAIQGTPPESVPASVINGSVAASVLESAPASVTDNKETNDAVSSKNSVPASAIEEVAPVAESAKSAGSNKPEVAPDSVDAALQEIVEESEKEPEIISISEKLKGKLLSKLVFEWDVPVSASVFKRADYLWIVFDKAKDVNVSSITINNPEYFLKGEKMPNRFYTILRLKLRSDVNTVAYKENNNWVVGFTKIPEEPEHITKIETKFSELTGSQVILADVGKIKPLRLIDPEVGDEIIILPYANESTGIKERRKYVDFVMLQTSQGAAIQVKSDDVNMVSADSNINITGPANRIASKTSLAELREKEEEAKQKAERLKQQDAELTMLKFNSWALGGESEYKKNLGELEWKITEADWSEKNSHRLALARFYFANGMEAEALGVIKTIKDSDSKLVDDNDIKMLEATSLYLMSRYNEALTVYNSINLSELGSAHKDEVAFWKNATSINISNLVKPDKFIAKNPLKKEGAEEEDGTEDKVANTKLMRDTSMRLLKMIRKMDPDFVNAEELQKLEATTRFVTNHYQEAIKRFEETDLYSSGDIFQAEDNKLWWSANVSSENKRNDTAELPFLVNLDGFLKNYPSYLLNDFALLALEDALKRNDLARAEEILGAFKEENRYTQKDSIEFFRGLYFAKNDEDVKAIETWDKLTEEIPDPFNRARAKFAKTILQLDKKKIDVKQAIANLNSIRSLWRGGQFEFHVLNLLGEFYMETGQPMEGFRVWKEAVTAFPDTDESLMIAKKMSHKFVKIFSQGEADKMSQIDAITLYYEFRELTPIGKLGDDMISKLIDRLIDIDLLDRATALLTHQVRFRLSGDERNIASTKLVKIHMMNHDPQKAIDVLDATESPNMTSEISTVRKYLRAQALLDLGKNNKVITLLQDDNSTNAAFLRADVYWNNGVWRKVVDELEVPFREIRRNEKRLDAEETNQLIKLAVSYALIDRQKRLQVLYEDFSGFIDDPNKKNLLTFIASNKDSVDFKNLEETVGYKDMENFLNNYLKAPAEQGKSS